MSNSKKILDYYNDLKLERQEYMSKAKKIDFKPVIPKMPRRNDDLKLLDSTLSGFIKRFNNWKLNLLKFEQSRM
jgi:hypothetical protein